jgi:hypothetical protein
MTEELKFRVTKVGKKEENGDWTWETKIDAVQKFLSLGNVRAVCDITRVPYETLRYWRQEPWWTAAIEEMQAGKRAQLANKLASVAEKSLELVEDRLENGDYILNNKTGQIMRKPAALKDVAKLATDMIGRQIELEKQNSSATTEDGATIQETLKKLANEFAKFNKRINASAEDVAYKELGG